ncbi:hypothetical protein GCM10028808_26290 [Spirosoma migulaei]
MITQASKAISIPHNSQRPGLGERVGVEFVLVDIEAPMTFDEVTVEWFVIPTSGGISSSLLIKLEIPPEVGMTKNKSLQSFNISWANG